MKSPSRNNLRIAARLAAMARWTALGTAVGCAGMWLRSHQMTEVWAIFRSQECAGERTFSIISIRSGDGELSFSMHLRSGVGHPSVQNHASSRGLITYRHSRTMHSATSQPSVRRYSFGDRLPLGATIPTAQLVDATWFPPATAPQLTARHVCGEVKYWQLTCCTAFVYAAAFFLALARRRRRGLCENCGYDLRATPMRCPECGKESRSSVGTQKTGQF